MLKGSTLRLKMQPKTSASTFVVEGGVFYQHGSSGRQVSVLSKATKQAARLVMTGVKQRFYGYAAMGAAPTTQKRMRAVLASAGGYRKAGGCTTTVFALAGLTAADPWVEFP